MKVKIIDAHTHLQFTAFKNDYRKVIDRALQNGIGLINTGTNKETSRHAVEVAYEFEKEPVFACVGLHPLHTFKSFHDKQEEENLSWEDDFDVDYYFNLASKEKVVAIGECGLDYFRENSKEIINKQKEIFLKQLAFAKKVKKPLVIHCRAAFTDLIDILRSNKNLLSDPPGVVHFFSGDKQNAYDLMNLGFYFTFGGVITFATSYHEVLSYIPLQRILVETDAPYVAPHPYRGKRNEPIYIIETLKKIAEIKKVSVEVTSEVILENTKRLFNLPI